MDWYKRFKSKACILKLKGQTKEEILNEIADQLLSSKLIDASLEDNVRSALIAREELASTGVGMNVAIPHVKVEGLEEALFSLSVSKDGHPKFRIQYPVRLVVVLAPDYRRRFLY